MQTKIVEIPFVYNAQIIPYRSRNPAPRIVRDQVLVQVPDLTSDEAPLGIEWIQNDLYRKQSQEDRERYFPNGPYRIVTRFHDGRHYGRVRIPATGEPLRSDEFIRDAANPRPAHVWAGSKSDGSPRWSTRDFPVAPSIAKSVFRYREMSAFHFGDLADALDGGRIRGHDREERMAEAADFLSKSIIFVDGEVWLSNLVAEMWYGIRDRPEMPPELFVGFKQAASSYETPFRADRRADALAYAERLGLASGMPAAITEDEVIIHSPHAIVRDDMVMLASQIVAGAGTNLTNGREDWPDDAAASQRQLLDARQVPEPERDRAWAANVFLNAETVLGRLALLASSSYGREVCAGIQAGTKRWLDDERVRNPDLVAMMQTLIEDDRSLDADELGI